MVNGLSTYGRRVVSSLVTARARNRAQSEPLAALVAVALVCLAISGYVGVFTDVFGETGTERDVSEATADAVWQDIETNGTYDLNTSVSDAVSTASLPAGYTVAVTVTYVSEGTTREAGRAVFEPSGTVSSGEPPATSDRVERPVTVRLGPAERQPGQLVVEVWQ